MLATPVMLFAEDKAFLDEAEILNQKVIELYSAGKYEEAIPIAKKLLERAESDEPGSLNVAISLSKLAELYRATGRLTDAELLFKKTLEIYEKAFGKDNLFSITTLNGLAAIYRTTGRYQEAEQSRLKIIEVFEKTLGKTDPIIATSLDNLAVLYLDMGKYAEAEPLHKRALDIYEAAFGGEHHDVAITLNNLANLYKTIGRFSEAEQAFKRALQIYEKIFDEKHPSVAAILDNLAGLYVDEGRYSDAKTLRERALQIYGEAFGQYHPDFSITLSNLALVYAAMGYYSDAEAMFLKAEEINEKVFGKDHPGTASVLNNLAELYKSKGSYADAETLYKRSLEIMEKALGKDHPNVATSLNNLAILYAETDKHTEAHRLFTRSISIDDIKREDVFLLLSEKQKMDYMKQNEKTLYGFLTHTSKHMQTSPEAIIDTFNSWLKWKGAVMEAQGRYLDAVMYSDNPEIKQKFEELTNLRRETARLQMSKPEQMSFEDYKKQLEELGAKKEALEAELSRLSKDFALEKTVGKADVNKISELLPEDSVYIDFARIDMYDFKERRWGKSRYLVFVLIPQKEPVVKLIDMADAEELDKHIASYGSVMKKRAEFYRNFGRPPDSVLRAKEKAIESDMADEAKAIYGIVIKPLKPYIKDKQKLFISPDGNLNLIPFEVLVNSEGKYLMEEYLINYVAAGRDIIRFTDTAEAGGDALIMADPDYDMGSKEKIEMAKVMGISGIELKGEVSRDARGLRFNRLTETKEEADEIQKVLNDGFNMKAKNYQDKEAIEEVLFAAKSPRIFHLSTHGYFLEDEESKAKDMKGFITQGAERLPDAGIENPMLRSGIVFAGVNTSLKEGKDDGLVSAEKILGLKLKGTELVVLSACKTGIGDVKSGEGVFGLKRAFILSGAKTVVMSLWNVPSRETTELMLYFYRVMSEGKTKTEALREAKLKMMEKNPNPFFWGAFVMVGKPD